MLVAINPGTGDCLRTTYRATKANLRHLLADASIDAKIVQRPKVRGRRRVQSGGRYRFVLSRHGQRCEILMPGLRLDRVRYLDGDAWAYPRLYVAGSSWLWSFAIWAVQRELTPWRKAAQ